MAEAALTEHRGYTGLFIPIHINGANVPYGLFSRGIGEDCNLLLETPNRLIVHARNVLRWLGLFAVCAGLTITAAHAADVSGRLWNDANRDGIQDLGEVGLSGVDVYIAHFTFPPTIATNTTDASGSYSFSGMTNGNYYVWVFPPTKYAFTVRDAGGDDEVDNDFDFYFSDLLSITGAPITHLDAGVYILVPGIYMSTTANGVTNGTPLYVTNGTVVEFIHSVTNNGETPLSSAFVYNPTFDVFVEVAYCPSSMFPGNSFSYSTQVVATASFTNYAEAIAFPVTALTCSEIAGLDPVISPNFSAVIVVEDLLDYDGDTLPNWWETQYGFDPLTSNAPGMNSDGDWMTDVEEFISDTIPTNAASYLPNATMIEQWMVASETYTSRIYSTWWSTNLLDEPQTWTRLSPEQTGTGSMLWFSFTNQSPMMIFRTGVRLP